MMLLLVYAFLHAHFSARWAKKKEAKAQIKVAPAPVASLRAAADPAMENKAVNEVPSGVCASPTPMRNGMSIAESHTGALTQVEEGIAAATVETVRTKLQVLATKAGGRKHDSLISVRTRKKGKKDLKNRACGLSENADTQEKVSSHRKKRHHTKEKHKQPDVKDTNSNSTGNDAAVESQEQATSGNAVQVTTHRKKRHHTKEKHKQPDVKDTNSNSTETDRSVTTLSAL
jgi:hypothetical protein